jgi:hypothetical protein
VVSGKELGQTPPNPQSVSSLVFLPYRGKLAASYKDETIHLWNIANAKEIRTLTADNDQIVSLACSPDGRFIATGGNRGQIRIWEVASGDVLRQFQGHEDEVACFAFAPNGQTLSSGGSDHNILVWDLTGLFQNGSLPPLQFSSKDLAALWDFLARPAPAANRAMWKLVAASAQGVALCKKKLQPVPPPDEQHLAGLIKKLDAESFTAREKATRELESLGDIAGPALRQALSHPSLEVRVRAQRLLDKVEGVTPLKLQEIRAVAVLEYIGTGAAKEVLEVLAEGAPGAQLTLEAKASLERLNGNGLKNP